jgi:hypothetical protein
MSKVNAQGDDLGNRIGSSREVVGPALDEGSDFVAHLRRRPIVQLHPQLEVEIGEEVFDLLERFATKVFGLEHLRLGLLHKVTNVLDVGVLKTVLRADRQFKLINGTEEAVIEEFDLFLDFFDVWLKAFVEGDEDVDLLLDDLGRVGDSVFREDRTIRPNTKREAVVVCLLANTSVGDAVVDLADWTEQAVDRNNINGLLGIFVTARGDITTTRLDRKLHLKTTTLRESRDGEPWVEDFNLRVGLDVSRGDNTRPALINVNCLLLVTMDLQKKFFDLEDNVRHILFDVGKSGKLMQGAIDAHRRHSSPLEAGQEDPAKAVTEGRSESAFERLADKLGVAIGLGGRFNPDLLRLDEISPVPVHGPSVQA